VIDWRESAFESRDVPTISLRAFLTSELFFTTEVPEQNLPALRKDTGDPAPPSRARRAIAARVPALRCSPSAARRAYELAPGHARAATVRQEIADTRCVGDDREMATEIEAGACWRAFSAPARRADVEASMAVGQ
jgi:hypothetical protein